MQYLDGKVKEAVERYEGMGSGALLEALSVLKTRFGQPYMIDIAFKNEVNRFFYEDGLGVVTSFKKAMFVEDKKAEKMME
jgi:hypothetical protein